MILSEKLAEERLSSPTNLMNRLSSMTSGNTKRKNAMSLFVPSGNRQQAPQAAPTEEVKITFNPFDKKSATPAITSVPNTPPIESLIENADQQVDLALAHDKALRVLNSALGQLETKLDDVKADRLPGVITAASKVVESIRKERAEATKSNKDREVHYHFYTPQQRKVAEYDIIDVGAVAVVEQQGEA